MPAPSRGKIPRRDFFENGQRRPVSEVNEDSVGRPMAAPTSRRFSFVGASIARPGSYRGERNPPSCAPQRRAGRRYRKHDESHGACRLRFFLFIFSFLRFRVQRPQAAACKALNIGNDALDAGMTLGAVCCKLCFSPPVSWIRARWGSPGGTCISDK